MPFIRSLKSVVTTAGPRTSRTQQRLSRAAAIADVRELARRRLIPGVFDYGGAEAEWSLRANQEAFESLQFDPRVLVAWETSIRVWTFRGAVDRAVRTGPDRNAGFLPP